MLRHIAPATALAIVVIGVPPRAEADDPGCARRVRVTAPSVDHRRLVGSVVTVDDERITLWRDRGRLLEVPRSAVVIFEECRRRGQKGRGMRNGALVGIGLAAAGAIWAMADDCRGFGCFSPGATFVLGAVIYAPIGALVGAGIAPDEEWQTSTPDRFRVTVAPARGGVRAGLTIAF